jgi:hypothetical protein
MFRLAYITDLILLVKSFRFTLKSSLTTRKCVPIGIHNSELRGDSRMPPTKFPQSQTEARREERSLSGRIRSEIPFVSGGER